MMKFGNHILIVSLMLIMAACGHSPESKRFAVWDFTYMQQVKKSLKSEGAAHRPAYENLIKRAAEAMDRGPYSVTFKNIVPPGGTRHDYMSMGPYWWPDPSKPDGLPYIRRDGVVNPESGIDKKQLKGLIDDVRTLSLAWYFSGNKDYARKAAELLRIWFLNDETLMNPHLEFGQAIPGRTTGRGIGIIDTKSFSTLVDAILLLESSGALRKHEEEEIRLWFVEYFNWLTTSQHGKDEDVYPNNHSVAYDVQVTSIARFIGNDDYVKAKISAVPSARIDKMIRADGRQPEELIRTKAYGYSVANLANFFDVGETGLKIGIDIFSYTNPEGGSLQKALEFVAGYLGQHSDWPWEQIADWEQTENNLGLLLRRAARYFNNPEYKIMWEQAFAQKMGKHWSVLVIPGM